MTNLPKVPTLRKVNLPGGIVNYVDNEYYHVYNRGAHQARIFFSDRNYFFCLRLAQKYLEKYAIRISAYCLMPNHYHFLLTQKPGGSISRFLQTTFNAYTQAINKSLSHSGTLFQGKAKSKHVDSDSAILQLVRYIHLNPVEACLVKSPKDWKYSDFTAWIKPSNSFLTDLSLRETYFRDGHEYESFVQEYQRDRSL